MSTGRVHWLLDVARQGGLEGTEELDLPTNSLPGEAWTTVTTTTGVAPKQLARLVADRFRLEVAHVEAADPSAARLVPEAVARKYHVCPLHANYHKLTVATADPTNLDAEQALQFSSGRSIVFQAASPAEVEEGILLVYAPDQAAVRLMEEAAHPSGLHETIQLVEDEVEEEQHSEATLGSGPVVRLVNLILHEAIELGASDIHVQPTEKGGLIRYRVDGVLRTVSSLPLSALTRVVSRIKIIGKMDISDRLRPQDGRARLNFKGRLIDLRISTVPTRKAEKAVLRILDPSQVKGLEEVGFSKDELLRFQELVDHRDGIVVVTGPTGSGKTTTMYAALKDIHDEEINIMTVEDPVEFDLPDITQIQVEPKQGVTFASALRAFLRQDPDVIFVGEIRDSETAQMAVQASMTGHLVLATLHTNDAAGSLKRLADMGLTASSINETFRGAVAQRLMRRPCPECRQEIGGDLTEREREIAARYGAEPIFRAVGCEECGQSGYQGRVPIFQIMHMTAELRTLVQTDATPDQIEEAARKGGMLSLTEAALDRLAAGKTTLDEMERVLGEVDAPPEGAEADVAPEMPSAPLAAEGAPPGSSSPAESGGEGDGTGRLVLIVDDDIAARTLTRALLEMEGCRVTEAEDGEEALGMLTGEGELPALVVLDLNMPRMDGEAMLLRLRDSIPSSDLPVLVLTGSTDTETEVRLVEAGADDYVRKPVEPRLFLSRVRAALRRSAG